MLRKGSSARIALLLALLNLINMGILAQGAEKPSIMVLLNSTGAAPAWESVKMVNAANELFKESREFKTIDVSLDAVFWPTVHEATKFGSDKNADYMVFIDISKIGGTYSYRAKLLKPREGHVMANYVDKWSDEQTATKEAIGGLVSNVLFTSLTIITVNMTIESNPPLCDVFRGSYRIGYTDKDGSFRQTFYWRKGTYTIKVCKPGYKDWFRKLKVEENPTFLAESAMLEQIRD